MIEAINQSTASPTLYPPTLPPLQQGSRDATVRLWDVRRSGPTACLTSLDQHADHHRRRAPGLMGGPTELARAHDGWVVALAFTPNGGGLLSAGTDKRLRLWNAATGEHSLRNFRGTRNDRPLGWSITAIQPGAAATGAVLYPNGASGDVHLYTLGGSVGDGAGQQGRPLHVLRGHLDAVSSAVYRRDAGQVVTGGADALILVFDCSRHEAAEGRRLEEAREGEGRAAALGMGSAADGGGGDAWSSDEEEEEEAAEGAGAGNGARRRGFVPPIIQQLITGGGTLPLPPPAPQPQQEEEEGSDNDGEGSGRRCRGGGSGRSSGGGGRKRSRDGRGGGGGSSRGRGRGRGRMRR